MKQRKSQTFTSKRFLFYSLSFSITTRSIQPDKQWSFNDIYFFISIVAGATLPFTVVAHAFLQYVVSPTNKFVTYIKPCTCIRTICTHTLCFAVPWKKFVYAAQWFSFPHQGVNWKHDTSFLNQSGISITNKQKSSAFFCATRERKNSTDFFQTMDVRKGGHKFMMSTTLYILYMSCFSSWKWRQ